MQLSLGLGTLIHGLLFIHPSAWKGCSRTFVRRLLTLPYGGGSTLGPNMEIANDRRLKIGELARQTGLSIKTIRYYERRGLLEQPPRTQGGYRLYGLEEVARVQFILTGH